MQTYKELCKKRLYTTPTMTEVKLDNEISLQMASLLPPEGPDEFNILSLNHFNNEPYNKNQA